MGFTVSELIRELEGLKDQHGDVEVKFCYDYGDYNHTEVARGVDGIHTGYVTNSSYLRSDKVIASDDYSDEYEKFEEIEDMTDEQREEEDYRIAILFR